MLRYFFIFLFLGSLLAYENCGSPGGSGSAFDLASSAPTASATGALTASGITLNLPTYAPGGSMGASVTATGSNLNNVTCTWTIVNSSDQPISTPVTSTGVAIINAVMCSATLTAPTTVGSNYGLQVQVTNSGGELTGASTSFSVQTVTAPPPSATASANPPPTATKTPPPSTSGVWTLLSFDAGGASGSVGLCSSISGKACSPVGTTEVCTVVIDLGGLDLKANIVPGGGVLYYTYECEN